MKKIISTQLLRKLIKIQLLENYKKNILLEEPQEYNRQAVRNFLNIDANQNQDNTTTSLTNAKQQQQLSLNPKKILNYYDDYEEYKDGQLEDLKIKLTESILNKESYRKIIDNLFTEQKYQNVLRYLKIPPRYIITTINIQPNAEPLDNNERNQYQMLFNTSIDDVKNQIIDQLDTLFQSKKIPANYTIIFPMKYIKRKIVNFIVDDITAKDEIDTAFKRINFHNLLDEKNNQITQGSFNALPTYNIIKKTISGGAARKDDTQGGTQGGTQGDNKPSVTAQKSLTEIFKELAKSNSSRDAFNKLNLKEYLKLNGSMLYLDTSDSVAFLQIESGSSQKVDERITILKKSCNLKILIDDGINLASNFDIKLGTVDIKDQIGTNLDEIKKAFEQALMKNETISFGKYVLLK
jgi:hypothetical protein